jgi:RNA polymerase sigma-B factor
MLDTTLTPTRSQRAFEDARLFDHYRRTRDTDARDELVLRFMPLAQSLAGRYAHRGERDDLNQVASFALLKAIDRYDPSRGLAFSTFAVPTILGELKRYFRDYGWAVRVPRDLQERSLSVTRATERLTTRLGRSPTPAEIAEALDTTVESVLEALQTGSAYTPDRLDPRLDADEEERTQLVVGVDEIGYAEAEASATLSPLLADLTDRERLIVRLRFEHDMTQSEIGMLIGVSQMQISRILRKSIAHMQEQAAAVG